MTQRTASEISGCFFFFLLACGRKRKMPGTKKFRFNRSEPVVNPFSSQPGVRFETRDWEMCGRSDAINTACCDLAAFKYSFECLFSF